MIDHISVRAQDFSKILDFYRAALAPIGYQVLMQFEGAAGLGAGGKPDLWIMQTDKPLNPTHVAISGERSQIAAFHEAALAAGGTDNGAPGARPDYHEHYYAAFIYDPEGNNIEVVCHAPAGASKSAKSGAKSASKSGSKSAAKKSAASKPAAKKPTVKARATTSAKPAAKAAAKKPAKPAKPAMKPAAKSKKRR
jgi:catechol 2,3-dioxygenase-like lactoylglutathione lyase family enzyme